MRTQASKLALVEGVRTNVPEKVVVSKSGIYPGKPVAVFHHSALLRIAGRVRSFDFLSASSINNTAWAASFTGFGAALGAPDASS